ncbi:MAG: 3-hydroxyacyl-ACP dehydratase FabZ [Planctomycetes bacterium]|nr:3-hydroxyacyl-ACP dehydratase FabZ [Planctomycetota bacterium]
MSEFQKTIARSVTIEGRGLHLGEPVRMRFLPAEVNRGFVFRVRGREKSGDVPARVENLYEKELRSALIKDGVVVETVEHVLAAAFGMGISNLIIELDGNEPPACDGSAAIMCAAIMDAGIVDQSEEKKAIVVKSAFTFRTSEGACISVFPNEGGLKVSYTLAGRGLPSQYVEYEHSPQGFLDMISSSRTFCREFEVQALREMVEVGQGASEENTIVVDMNTIGSMQRMPDELARHKILDLLGDLSLLGQDLHAHVVCQKSGHRSNHELVKGLNTERQPFVFDIKDIMEILPYGYPFLLVDRIIEYQERVHVVGLKNVTINEPFFQGHFQNEPIMPGVLQIEALAQTGVVFLYRNNPGSKLVLFTGVDKVKFRNRVVPGDQLILEVTAKNMKSHIGLAQGLAKVNGEVVCEALLKFMVIERAEQ